MKEIKIKGRKVFGGIAEGEALVTTKTLSGYGCVDHNTGNIIDKFHELYGQNVKDKILVFRGAKGSSGWAGIFHMARLSNTAPAGLIFTELTSKICLGIVAMKRPSITELELNPFEHIETRDYVKIDACKGEITIIKKERDE